MNKVRGVVVSFIFFIISTLVMAEDNDNKDCFSLFDTQYPNVSGEIKENILGLKTGYEKLKYFLSLNKEKIFRYKTMDVPVKKTSKKDGITPSIIYPPSLSVVGIDIRYDKLDSITSSSVMNFLKKFSGTEQKRNSLKKIYDVLVYLKQYDPSFYTQVILDIQNIIYKDPLQIAENLIQQNIGSVSLINSVYRYSIISRWISRVKEIQEVNSLINRISDRIQETRFFEYLDANRISKKDKAVYIKDLAFSFNMAMSFLFYEYYHGQSYNKMCSAVVVAHNVLITAAHCISMADHILFTRNGQRYEAIVKEYNPLFNESHIIIGRDSDQTSAHDIGVAIFPDNTFKGISATRLAKRKISSGEDLVITGFNPLTREFVAQKIGGRSNGKGRKIYISLDSMRIIPGPHDLKSEHGNSGSPVFNEQDRVVALLVSGRKERKLSGEYETIDIYVKIEENLEYLRSICERYGCKISGIN